MAFNSRREFMSSLLLVGFLAGGFATNGRAEEQKHYWQGTTVGMFMDIKGQQFSYVAGFIDNAIFAYHQLGYTASKWLVECLADHPETTNPVEITRAIIGKFNTVLKDHPKITDEPVGLFIWAELEVRCGQVK